MTSWSPFHSWYSMILWSRKYIYSSIFFAFWTISFSLLCLLFWQSQLLSFSLARTLISPFCFRWVFLWAFSVLRTLLRVRAPTGFCKSFRMLSGLVTIPPTFHVLLHSEQRLSFTWFFLMSGYSHLWIQQHGQVVQMTPSNVHYPCMCQHWIWSAHSPDSSQFLWPSLASSPVLTNLNHFKSSANFALSAHFLFQITEIHDSAMPLTQWLFQLHEPWVGH